MLKSIRPLVLKSLEALDLESQKRLASALLETIIAREGDPERCGRWFETLERYELQAEDHLRKLRAWNAQPLPERRDAVGEQLLRRFIMDPDAPWLSLRPDKLPTPGMPLPEEIQYYHYIGTFYTGRGEAIELGPWLGLSTQHILKGLARGPHSAGHKLNVFDDFTWRSHYMDQYVRPEDRLPDQADFQPLFRRHVAAVLDKVDDRKVRFYDLPGNDALPPLSWDGRPIEIMYIDCGRTAEGNRIWFDAMS